MPNARLRLSVRHQEREPMKFDRQSAVPIFARKESDELIQIAFLEESYVEEAKELARQELAKREVVPPAFQQASLWTSRC